MSRIFLSLALFSLVLLAINLVLGLTIGDYAAQSKHAMAASSELNKLQREAQQDPSRISEVKAAQERLSNALIERAPTANRKVIHTLFGVATSLVALLVNCISVTYFVGTSKWCGEVSGAYTLDDAKALESQRLKRKNFPWAVLGSLTILGIVVLGAMADPDGMMREEAVGYINFHLIAALIGIAIIAWCYFKQAHYVASNFLLIQDILDQVKAIRLAKGLDAQ